MQARLGHVIVPETETLDRLRARVWREFRSTVLNSTHCHCALAGTCLKATSHLLSVCHVLRQIAPACSRFSCLEMFFNCNGLLLSFLTLF